MGYTLNVLTNILENRDMFVDKKIVTLGVLYPYISQSERRDLSSKYGFDFLNIPVNRFSEFLFVEFLGAEVCDVLDVSDYQGAKIISNLNIPISRQFHSNYDVVVDSGTLEHLSNLQTSLENIFSLLVNNGVYFFGAPANGWVDHGFYQFSPTFYEDFSFENSGVVLERLAVSNGKLELSVLGIHSILIQSFINSFRKVTVEGVIRKISEDKLSFDFIQRKYRMMHLESKIGEKYIFQTQIKAIGHRITQRIVNSYFLPFSLKKIILSAMLKYR